LVSVFAGVDEEESLVVELVVELEFALELLELLELPLLALP
jgi:hypothetical protein